MFISVVLAVIVVLIIVGEFSTRHAELVSPPLGEFVSVDGERIHLLDLGPRKSAMPPVILIHGASVNSRDMKLALGDPLSKSRRVIIVDRPGRGYSTRPDDGWRLDVQARLIHRAVEKLDVERPIIVGQSFGGAVALSYALNFQNEISGLVLLASVSHEWPGDVAWYNKVSGWPIAGTLLRRIVIPIYAPFAAKNGVIESFEPDDAPAQYYERSGLTLLFRPKDFQNNAADLRHLKAQIIDMSARYGEIKTPTAILTGANDSTVSPTLHSAALAREIDGAFFEVLPDTGHALHHSETAKVISAIDLVAERERNLKSPQSAAL